MEVSAESTDYKRNLSRDGVAADVFARRGLAKDVVDFDAYHAMVTLVSPFTSRIRYTRQGESYGA